MHGRKYIGLAALLALAVLGACRVTETPAPAYPGPPVRLTVRQVTSVPPTATAVPARTRVPTRPATQAVSPTPSSRRTATRPATKAVPPTPLPQQTATPLPPLPTPGEVAFRLTILHTGEVGGEVLPCG